MSFKQLLINKDFVCRKLMINKPLLELSGLSNSHSDSTYNPPFDPFLLIKIFKSRSFGKTDIYLNIDSTFINFGKVNILENKTQNGNGNAAYSLEITGLKTQKQNNINELTYNELNAGVGKFNYYFPSKNLHLFIDTAFYLSHKKLITIKNAQLNETRNSNSNTPLFHAGKMILQGVLLYNTDTLNLKKIYLKKFLLQNSTLIYKNTKNQWPSVELIVENNDLFNSTAIGFNENMSSGLDPSFDIGKMKGNPGIALYSKLIEDNGIDFAIQALPLLNNEKIEIKIGLDISETGNYNC